MFNEIILMELGIDVKKGLAQMAFDEELYQRYLKKMLETDYCGQIEQKVIEGQVEDAFKLMHHFKALVKYVCVTDIIDIVVEMTETLRVGKTIGVLDGIKFVELKFNDIREHLGIQIKNEIIK